MILNKPEDLEVGNCYFLIEMLEEKEVSTKLYRLVSSGAFLGSDVLVLTFSPADNFGKEVRLTHGNPKIECGIADEMWRRVTSLNGEVEIYCPNPKDKDSWSTAWVEIREPI